CRLIGKFGFSSNDAGLAGSPVVGACAVAPEPRPFRVWMTAPCRRSLTPRAWLVHCAIGNGGLPVGADARTVASCSSTCSDGVTTEWSCTQSGRVVPLKPSVVDQNERVPEPGCGTYRLICVPFGWPALGS